MTSIQKKLDRFIEEHGDATTCIFDWDETLYNNKTHRTSNAAKKMIADCPHVGILTYNTGVHHEKCCTDQDLIDLGLCVDGSCIVDKHMWARRKSKSSRMLLAGRDVGSMDEYGKKKDIMVNEMGLDPKNTIFFDDLKDNVDPAREAGITAVHVLNGNI